MQNIVGKKSQNIRKPVMAGQFYPNNKQELNAILSLYLMQAKIARRDNNPRIIIAPHAGYQFSGPVAAFAFKGLQNSGYKRAILIGRSHQEYFAGIAVDDNEAWATPLTSTPVDKDFIARLQKTDSEIVFNSFVHQNEHCLEVELPFLQIVLGNDIKIVPLLFGDNNATTIAGLVESLAKIIDEKNSGGDKL